MFMKHNAKISKQNSGTGSLQTPDDNTKKCSKASGRAKSLALSNGDVKT